jgi:hypothetical protein
MKYAIVEDGGKQYKAVEGTTIDVIAILLQDKFRSEKCPGGGWRDASVGTHVAGAKVRQL